MSSNLQMDDSPWLVPAAVAVMDEYLAARDGARVFEWGAGGSTLWFARRAAIVTTVEHNLEWHNRVAVALSGLPSNPVALVWMPAERGMYAEWIHNSAWGFDLILVDGILRNECIANAILYLRHGGLLVVDNTERADEYAAGLALLNGWDRRDFSGDCQTSIFTKP